MFERYRIGGVIYNLGDRLTEDGAPVDRRVRELYDPFLNIAVKDMKLLKLKADQAAVAMIINLVNTLQTNSALRAIRDERYDLFISLIRLYHGACLLMWDRPEYFKRARALFDNDVFKASHTYELDASAY